MSFDDKLTRRVIEADSLLCVGLDPHPADLDNPKAECARDFCLRLIEATASVAAAYKANSAFFEAYGPDGLAGLHKVLASIPEGIPVILDAKRGDIASTAQSYVQAAFKVLGADAVTINPYLGGDAIEPFLVDPERGVFLLCKTSNPGAGDLQDSLLAEAVPGIEGEYHVYEKVARLASGWNSRNNLGLVVGATHPEALRRVRIHAPDLWILAPGVGVQGGELIPALRVGLRHDRMGILITVSRGISQSPDPKKAAEEIRDQINTERNRIKSTEITPAQKNTATVPSNAVAWLAENLLRVGCIKFGRFTLKSGMVSPIYIDLRQLVSYPKILAQVAGAYLPLLHKLSFHRLAGLPYAALPIATCIAVQGGWPLIYPRKEAKTYGTMAEIEGIYNQGEKIVIIDDIATTGGSKLEAIEKLKAAGLVVKDIVVLIDRQSDAKEQLENAGFTLHTVATLSELLDYFEDYTSVAKTDIAAARAFLNQKQ